MNDWDAGHVFSELKKHHERAETWWHRDTNHRTFMLIGVVTILVLLIYGLLIRPPKTFVPETIVTIPKGATVTETVSILKEEHIVRSAFFLRIVTTLMSSNRGVLAGDYQFHESPNTFSVAQRITTGAFGLEPVRVLIPEGASVAEMAIIYGKRLPRLDEDAFIKEATPLEGYLFPDTYFFLPNATHKTVIDAMLNNFEEQFATLEEEFVAFGKPLEEVVIMASLLEKEEHKFEPKRGIAGVLWNRIDINMPLQVDATFLYINGKSTFTLTLDDLQNNESPYNTYKFKGLPPGPITNPGLDSLRAAMTPIEHDYLFYLADHNGTTYFSETYAEHLRKKNLYLGS